MVAVGRDLHLSEKWKTFPDFLFEYPKIVFGPDWWQAEFSKPEDDRHQVCRWCVHLSDYLKQHGVGVDGLLAISPDAISNVYNVLAYDLYVVRHHRKLQEVIVHRLKNPDQFQGARHELFVSATLIRAGFDVEFEDESDSSVKHPELVATHRASGKKISVEAKSRHRPGVLGREGHLQAPHELKLGVRRLLNRASEKPSVHPLVAFIDLNLPYECVSPENNQWLDGVRSQIAQLAADSVAFPFALVVVTNCPDHYGEPVDGKPVNMAYFAHVGDAVTQLANSTIPEDIEHALRQHGVFPEWFPGSNLLPGG